MEKIEEFHQNHEKEILMIISQYLSTRGYKETSSSFQKESGLSPEISPIKIFKNLLTEGKFDQALDQIPEIEEEEEKAEGLKMAIIEHKYIELLVRGDSAGALEVLREQIVPMMKRNEERGFEVEGDMRIADLTSMIIDVERLAPKVYYYDVLGKDARENLFSYLKNFISPKKILKDKLLEKLLRTSLSNQIQNCKCYGFDKEESQYSLLEHHECSTFAPDKALLLTFSNHKDEVWYVSLSPDTKKLATVSKDKEINIWSLEKEESKLSIKLLSNIKESHTNKVAEISTLVWHPDSSKILTACDNIKIFDINTGNCEITIESETSCVLSAAWVNKGEQIILAEPEKGIKLINAISGDKIEEWEGLKYIGVAAAFQSDIIAYCSENEIGTINLADKVQTKMASLRKVRAITMSKCGQYLLVNRNNLDNDNKVVIDLWDISKGHCLQKYSGHIQEKNIIVPQFGGKFEKYIISGSEDDKVYIWDRESGDIVETLESHQNVVNSVSWADNLPQFLFSCSYDQSIRIWGNYSDNIKIDIDPKYLFFEDVDSEMEDEDSDDSMMDEDSAIDSEGQDSDDQ